MLWVQQKFLKITEIKGYLSDKDPQGRPVGDWREFFRVYCYWIEGEMKELM